AQRDHGADSLVSAVAALLVLLVFLVFGAVILRIAFVPGVLGRNAFRLRDRSLQTRGDHFGDEEDDPHPGDHEQSREDRDLDHHGRKWTLFGRLWRGPIRRFLVSHRPTSRESGSGRTSPRTAESLLPLDVQELAEHLGTGGDDTCAGL